MGGGRDRPRSRVAVRCSEALAFAYSSVALAHVPGHCPAVADTTHEMFLSALTTRLRPVLGPMLGGPSVSAS